MNLKKILNSITGNPYNPIGEPGLNPYLEPNPKYIDPCVNCNRSHEEVCSSNPDNFTGTRLECYNQLLACQAECDPDDILCMEGRPTSGGRCGGPKQDSSSPPVIGCKWKYKLCANASDCACCYQKEACNINCGMDEEQAKLQKCECQRALECDCTDWNNDGNDDMADECHLDVEIKPDSPICCVDGAEVDGADNQDDCWNLGGTWDDQDCGVFVQQ